MEQKSVLLNKMCLKTGTQFADILLVLKRISKHDLKKKIYLKNKYLFAGIL